MKRKHYLKFPENEYRYWQLVWIGRIVYRSKQFKVELFFKGKNTPTEDSFNYNLGKIKEQIVSVSYLSEYSIGSIYDCAKNSLLQGSSENISTTKYKEIYFSRKPFPLEKHINIDDNIFESLSYLVLYAKKKSQAYHILISPYVLLKYFLGKSDKLIRLALRGKLYECFFMSSVSFYIDSETKERIAKLEYNSQKLSKAEAEIIAPLLFHKNKTGLTFLKSIGSQTLSAIMNIKEDTSVRKYLSFQWRFSNYEVSLSGQRIQKTNIIESEEKREETTEKNYFLAYEINSFKFLHNETYNINRIILIPRNPKNSTEDRKNHTPIDVKREATPQVESSYLQINQDSTTTTPPIKAKPSSNIISSSSIKVDFERRNRQDNAYNTTLIPNNKEYEGVVRDLDNFTNDSKNIRENIDIQIERITELSNFEYFNGVINILTRDYETLKVNQNLFSENSNKPISIDGKSFRIIELFYQNISIYLIEFETGLIGMFYHMSKKSISNEDLEIIILDFIKKGEEIKKQKSRRLLWTFIELNFLFYQREFGIHILKGIKHVRKLKSDNTEEKQALEAVYRETARKIVEYRVKKIP